jgi:hypothetical protein
MACYIGETTFWAVSLHSKDTSRKIMEAVDIRECMGLHISPEALGRQRSAIVEARAGFNVSKDNEEM